MIEIQPLQPDQIQDAKYVIYSVAQRIFEPDSSPEEFAKMVAEDDELDDLDDYREIYTARRGLFLVVLDDGKVIGTGAIRKLEEDVAELKRIWLLEDYHGRGIGYRVVSMLMEFARRQGYRAVRLQTSGRQTRAIAFYLRFGFHPIPGESEYEDDVFMEMET